MELHDVPGDGSCFFRALYRAAWKQGCLVRICQQLSVCPPNKTPTEDFFVTLARDQLAQWCLDPETSPYAAFFDHLHTVSPQDRAAILQAQPSWLNTLWQRTQHMPRAVFLQRVSSAVRHCGAWVSELDVGLFRAHCAQRGVELRVLTRVSPVPVSSDEPSVLYLVNQHETHYLYLAER